MMHSSGNVLAVSSKRKFEPRSSWLALTLGWKLLNVLRNPKKIVFSQTQKPSFVPDTLPTNPSPPPTPLEIQKLTRVEMEKRQLKVLCYNCDDKYFLRNKHKEQKIFMDI